MSNRPRSWAGWVLLSALAGSTCSCSSRPTLSPVGGIVLFQGNPAVKAVVVLRPVSSGLSKDLIAHGEVGPDGTFRIGTYADGDGAAAGEYTVTITWPETRTDPLTRDAISVDRLQGRYSDPAKSIWKVTIKPGENELPPFRLD